MRFPPTHKYRAVTEWELWETGFLAPVLAPPYHPRLADSEAACLTGGLQFFFAP